MTFFFLEVLLGPLGEKGPKVRLIGEKGVFPPAGGGELDERI